MYLKSFVWSTKRSKENLIWFDLIMRSFILELKIFEFQRLKTIFQLCHNVFSQLTTNPILHNSPPKVTKVRNCMHSLQIQKNHHKITVEKRSNFLNKLEKFLLLCCKFYAYEAKLHHTLSDAARCPGLSKKRPEKFLFKLHTSNWQM